MSDFNVRKDYTFEDSRIILRPLALADHAHLLPFAVTEPELWKYSLLSGAGPDGLMEYITTALAARESGREYPFIVYDKRTNEYAGSTRFYDIQPFHKTVQLGYTWYGKKFQGTGLNRHCKFLLLQFAFETLNIARIEFRADNENQRSIAAMKGIGCIVEGVLRSNMLKIDGGRRDSIILSILQHDWQGGVKNNLEKKLSLEL